MEKQEKFIPTTTAREIARGIVFRPVRSWHSDTFAGEQITERHGDGSGCMKLVDGMKMCPIPYTVTHRLYWNVKNPDYTISAFLSYPDAMGISGGEYFWETLGTEKDGDIERFFGVNAEAKMEKKIIAVLKKVRAPLQAKGMKFPHSRERKSRCPPTEVEGSIV